MSIHDKYPLASTTPAEVVAEAGVWPLNAADARARVKATAERVHQVLREGRVNVDSPALAMVAERTRALLEA